MSGQPEADVRDQLWYIRSFGQLAATEDLVRMGYPRRIATLALQLSRGDVELAVERILAGNVESDIKIAMELDEASITRYRFMALSKGGGGPAGAMPDTGPPQSRLLRKQQPQVFRTAPADVHAVTYAATATGGSWSKAPDSVIVQAKVCLGIELVGARVISPHTLEIDTARLRARSLGDAVNQLNDLIIRDITCMTEVGVKREIMDGILVVDDTLRGTVTTIQVGYHGKIVARVQILDNTSKVTTSYLSDAARQREADWHTLGVRAKLVASGWLPRARADAAHKPRSPVRIHTEATSRPEGNEVD